MKYSSFGLFTLCLFTFGLPTISQATIVTWTGSSNGTWNLIASNWSGSATSKFVNGDDVIFDDSGLATNPTITIQAAVTSVGAVTVSNSSGTFSFSGVLPGSTLAKSGAGILSFTSNTSPTFSSGVTLSAGTLNLRSSFVSNVNVTGNATIGSSFDGSLTLSGAFTGSSDLTLTPFSASRNLQFAGDMSGFSGKIKSAADGNLTFNTSALNVATASVELSGNTNLQGVATGTLQIGQITSGSSNGLAKGSNNGTLTFEVGALNNTSSIAGVITNNGSGITGATVLLTKVGTGTLTLSGANSYTGATTVNAGTLLVNGNQSASSGATTVKSTGTLGGSGTLGGAVTLENGSSIAPGDTGLVGTLTGTSVTWDSGATFKFELGAAGASIASPGTSDFLSLSGSLLKGASGGSGFTFDFLNTGNVGVYKLISTTGGFGTFVISDFSASNLASGSTGAFTIDTNQLYLTVTAIPEPSSYLLLGFVGLGFFLARRFRHPTVK